MHTDNWSSISLTNARVARMQTSGFISSRVETMSAGSRIVISATACDRCDAEALSALDSANHADTVSFAINISPTLRPLRAGLRSTTARISTVDPGLVRID